MLRALFILLFLLTYLLAIALVGACTVGPYSITPATPDSISGSEVSSEAVSGELIIFAAASLTDAFQDAASDFQRQYPNTEFVFNFAGSQQLAQQLALGAPADLFASANARQMEVTVEAGRVVSDTARVFVQNRLVVIYPIENSAGVTTLQELAKPGIKVVLAAAEVPVGAYSLDFLEKASATEAFGENYRESVLANVVSYEQNVRSVLSKVALGEADAGIVYTSDISGEAAAQVGQIEIPDGLNTVANYPIAVVSDSRNPALAEAFLAYILSPEGQAVLAEHGFIPIDTP